MGPSAPGWWRRPSNLWWGVVLAGLSVWAAARLGIFSLRQLVETTDGGRWLSAAFAGVDHPFHIARAETLRRSLLDGEILRWVGHHQGGYPVEFYPLGIAWLEVAVWALGLGFPSIPEAHTIVVATIFLLPGIAFALMANLDGWTPRVAVVALALHVVIPGDWWHGGYTELVQWGLVTNVGGAVAALFFLAWLTRFVTAGSRWAAIGAVLAAAAAVYTNPRSLIALAVAGGAVWLATVVRPAIDRQAVLIASRRVGLVAILAMLVAAPELLSLARFSDLYRFVRYERYIDAGAYLQSALAAVSTPVFLLAVAGCVTAGVTLSHVAARATAVTLLLYALLTMLLIGDAGAALSQLEPTRLMPFQRLLTVYLAAAAIELAVRAITARTPQRRGVVADVGIAVLVIGLLVGRASPVLEVPPVPGQTDPLAAALYPVERAAVPQYVDFQEAIQSAERAAAPGTSLLVIGSALSWHQRLWAPLWTDRPLLYDNWLWFWHESHAGTPGYSWSQGHHYPDPDRAVDPEYLEQHGIGAVVVTGPAAAAVAASPWLEQIRAGTYDVFRVRDPVTVVTFAGANAGSIEPTPSGLIATGTSDGGTALIRSNWFPRWQATVNGQPIPLSRTEDGYMTAPVAAGEVSLRLTYDTDGLDWLGRALSVIGLVGVVVVAGRPGRRPAAARPRTPAGMR